MAVTVLRGDTPVYSDPLSHSLFGDVPPALQKGEERGTLFTGAADYLLFRRDFTLDSTPYTVYLALPVKGEEAQDSARLAALCEEIAPAFFSRIARILEGEGTPFPAQTLPILYFFRMITKQICTDLYAPLLCEVAGEVENCSVWADRTLLSRAIGLALSALLREGQSTLCARLSGDDTLYALSLIGERAINSAFICHLLDTLAARGGFTVRHTENGVRFLLLPAHAPAALLRADPENDGASLCEGFFLLP